MTKQLDPHPNQDLFIKDLIDYSPKDDRSLMERPFFSLSKRKRNKPIEYTSDDKSVWVKVLPHPEFGMATIWDADIMIWCISKIVAEKERGKNMESPKIHTTPYELLRGIARKTGGNDYRLLLDAMNRLKHTSITTNLRAGKSKFASFSWLAEFEGEGSIDTPEQMEKVRSIALTLPSWIYSAITSSGNVLTLDREYFLLSGGLDRALYRIARKHAGGQVQGWLCTFNTLRQKTGSDSSEKKFAEMLKRSVRENKLPRYEMTLKKAADGQPAVHFVDRHLAGKTKIDEEIRQELERLNRMDEEDARAALIDAGANPRKPSKRVRAA